jgi:hypothetical protein
MAASIRMTGLDSLAKSIEAHDKKVKRVVAAQFLRAEQEAPGFMKLNAPWMDRTGNARAGLHAKLNIENQGEAFELIFAHTVFYGIFLEARFSGKFAIIMPTVNYFGSLLMDRIASSINRIDAS